ncbi:MAG TPA: adenosine deaminase [Amycolatopsis sp.]|jgi:aminodeoxyfutalosine deaminase|nr:adenosine deaminase [Amycolatopsis sp.]
MTAEGLIAALPKVDLHRHLLGSAGAGTVAELARRHPGQGVPTEPEAVAAWFDFTDFRHFLAAYTAVNRLVTSGADVEALIAGLAADLARENVRYAEVTVTPLSQLKTGIDPAELAAALDAGRRAAAAMDVEVAWIFDVAADDGPRGGLDTLDWVLRHQPAGTVAFGLGGPEQGFPRKLFRDSFAKARAAGLRSVPHAGETSDPGEVWSAVRDLGAERIGHGIAGAGDRRLLDHLAHHAITLEICPTSNLRTSAVGSLADHPLPRLLDAGVGVTIGTDDPGMFGTSLGTELRLCHEEFGLSTQDIVELVRTGIRAAFCPESTRRKLLAEVARVSRAVPAPPGA